MHNFPKFFNPETFARPWKKFKNMNPIGQIFTVNTVVYLMWKTNLFTESFMVKNFSLDPINIQEHRYHTLITHAFSESSTLSFILNNLMIVFNGQVVAKTYGTKYILPLALCGALSAGVFSSLFKQKRPVFSLSNGSQPIWISFFGLIAAANPLAQLAIFSFTVKAWHLFAFFMLSSILSQQKKDVGSLLAGLMTYYSIMNPIN